VFNANMMWLVACSKLNAIINIHKHLVRRRVWKLSPTGQNSSRPGVSLPHCQGRCYSPKCKHRLAAPHCSQVAAHPHALPPFGARLLTIIVPALTPTLQCVITVGHPTWLLHS
jgi:hypothetical protein